MSITFGIKIFVLFILVCAVLCVTCGPKTDEDQIRQLMREAGQCIEKKDVSGLMGLLSDDYADHLGRWLIHHAEWEHIGIEDLFPESLSILKKLFQAK